MARILCASTRNIVLLLAWVLAIPDCQHPRSHIQVAPSDPTDFFLTHGRRVRKFDNTTHWDPLAQFDIEVLKQFCEFFFCWTPIALIAFAD